MQDQKNDTPPTTPTEYNRRITIKNTIYKKIRKTGYEIEEALEYFTTLLEKANENEKMRNELEKKEARYADLLANVIEDKRKEENTNKKLRKAIIYLHKNDYWEILKKAEKGYYEFLEENDLKEGEKL